MKYINHVTLNTGHVRQTYPHEVDKSLFFVIRRILRDSQRPDGTEIYEGYRLKTTQDGRSTVATIIAESDGAPILTTAVSRDDSEGLWRLMHDTSTQRLATSPTDTPPTPYIADRIEIGAMTHLDAMRWTGDFSRCFGWVVLDPRKIR